MHKGSILIHNTTRRIGDHVVSLSEVTSTNELARQLLDEGLAFHGSLIRADFQSKGKGQEQSGWESERGQNLTCSIVLEPDLNVESQVFLNMAVSLAVLNTVQSCLPGEAVSIKWPNDIYVNNRKVCGILIENSLQGNRIRQSIVGIGLNINQQHFETIKACSISMLSGHHEDIDAICLTLTEKMNQRLQQVRYALFDQLKADYLAAFYRRNMITTFSVSGNIFDAIPIGIDEFGRLLVQHHNELKTYQVKEIAWETL